MNPEFLDVADVLRLHAVHLEAEGGIEGIRDPGLLDSALAQPRATFGAEYLHRDLFEMAAAYLFHLIMNHPFLDGNKRAGLAAALTFLEINGHVIERPTAILYDMTIGVAEGHLDKQKVADILRGLAT